MIDSGYSQRTLNEFLVRQAYSCPLKLWYHLKKEKPTVSKNPYRTKTRILMRKALSILYPGGVEAGDHHVEALEKTRDLLKHDPITIYGGVLAYQKFHARLPILKIEGGQLTLLQIHGKLWKQNQHEIGLEKLMVNNRKISEYVLEAAYKKWMIQKHFPNSKLAIRLCFPNQRFKSTAENLFRDVAYTDAGSEGLEEEISRLFVEVPVDKAVNTVIQENPELPVHPYFKNQPFVRQLEWMGNCSERELNEIPFKITGACNLCSFRKQHAGTENGEIGCWQDHLNNSIRQPQKQVFDLIGHGNKQQAENGNYFQEEISPPYEVESFEEIRQSGTSTLTVDQRRALQLLSANQVDIPRLWVKRKLLDWVRTVNYPLHFIDFEAATSAIPMLHNAKPYEPVFFQFSCHTMYADGNVTHHQWLDQNREGVPHTEFVREFLNIPDIARGTLVQYSPFEKQALNTLLKWCRLNCKEDEQLAAALNKIINGSDGRSTDRFLDMNRMVRDYYFNIEMLEGLGLKNVLSSILTSSSYLQKKYSKPVPVNDTDFILTPSGNAPLPDPYQLIQEDGEVIDDGSTAMNAWLHTKTPKCSQESRSRIHRLLKRYCTLDTLALVMIFQYWLHLEDRFSPEEDLIVRDTELSANL